MFVINLGTFDTQTNFEVFDYKMEDDIPETQKEY